MTRAEIRYFQTPEGRALLESAAAGGDPLRLQTALRKRYPAERVIAAMAQVELRSRARAKFSRADEMFFVREALEQASAETVARHRASRFATFGAVADICCGIGGDAIELARHAVVVAVDIRPERAALCGHNAAVHGVPVRPIVADAARWLPEADALFFDPSRRESGRRAVSLAGYAPAVDLQRFRGVSPHLGIKVAPGLDHAEIPPECEAEFISVDGECRELALWFGDLRSGPSIRATCLPGGHTLVGPNTGIAPVGPLGTHLHEPDRAVIRAHLVDSLAGSLGARKLAPDVAYLTTDGPAPSPFARSFRVDEVLPFSTRRLHERLRGLGIGRLEIKKRRFPMTPDEVRSRLRLRGRGAATVVLTRIAEEAVAILCDVEPGPP